jgi:hypothetical protein
MVAFGRETKCAPESTGGIKRIEELKWKKERL